MNETASTRSLGSIHMTSFRLLILGALVVLGTALAPDAAADEIEYIELDTSERKTMRVAEVTSETWAKVSFRRKKKGRGPEETIDTLQVIDVRRDDSGKTADRLATVEGEIRRGNYAEAARLAKSISGGGWKQDDDTGERFYTSFRSGDPSGRNKRPDWTSEYGHFLYAKALYLQAAEKDSKSGLQDALYALDDYEVQGLEEQKDGTKKKTEIKSGGFLARFDGGNSRFFADAMVLKANALVKLGKYKEAAAIFEELAQRALQVPLHPRYAYEAAIGPGTIKEAQGDLDGAINEYNKASGTIISLLDQERHPSLLAELGRAYSRTRTLGAAVKLRQAEAADNAGLFAKLKAQLKAESPDMLLRKFGTKPQPVKDAIVRGARDPMVRAVAGNGIGLAELKAKNYEEAVFAFKTVTVQHFQIKEQAARATYYLVEAAREAAKQAKSNKDAKAMYESMAAEAKKSLETTYGDTEWARKG